jgi:uncharacterized membrane protein
VFNGAWSGEIVPLEDATGVFTGILAEVLIGVRVLLVDDADVFAWVLLSVAVVLF